MKVFSASLSAIAHALNSIGVLCDPMAFFPSYFDWTVGNPLWIGPLVNQIRVVLAAGRMAVWWCGSGSFQQV
jgi:hypothetical protein